MEGFKASRLAAWQLCQLETCPVSMSAPRPNPPKQRPAEQSFSRGGSQGHGPVFPPPPADYGRRRHAEPPSPIVISREECVLPSSCPPALSPVPAHCPAHRVPVLAVVPRGEVCEVYTLSVQAGAISGPAALGIALPGQDSSVCSPNFQVPAASRSRTPHVCVSVERGAPSRVTARRSELLLVSQDSLLRARVTRLFSFPKKKERAPGVATAVGVVKKPEAGPGDWGRPLNM